MENFAGKLADMRGDIDLHFHPAILRTDHCILICDAGQHHHPIPEEALFLFAQGFFEKGTFKEEIDIIVQVNPAQLLGIDPAELQTHTPVLSSGVASG